ncbi:hypothetical protein RYX36_001747 [Vicia faba]
MFSYKPKPHSPLSLMAQKRLIVSPPHSSSPAPASASASATTHSYNAIINRHSTQGSHRQVLITYTSMLNTHVPSDAYTFPSLLKACSSLNLFLPGISLHQRIIVNGLSTDSYIASSLINFYVKFGFSQVARKVFDFMPERNVVPWTTVIGCYSRMADVHEAFSLFHQMRYQGIQPSSVTLLSLLFGVSEISHVQCLHGCATCYGFMSDLNLSNSMLNVYGKCGSIGDCRKLFDFIDQRDIVSWNSLLSAYAQIGDLCEVLLLLKTMKVQGFEPGLQTFGSVLSVAASRGDMRLGRLVHGQILRAGFDLDAHVETSLIVMYLKGGNIDVAFRMFETSLDKDVVLWTAMISGLVQNENADKALAVFHQMLKFGMKPSTETMASVITACAQMGSYNIGTSIHGYILRRELSLDTAAHNSLVTMYAKCGHLDQSSIVLVLSSCSHNGLIDQGLNIYESMTRDFGIAPNLEHHACVVDLLCRAGKVEEAYNLYTKMFSDPVLGVLGIILDACRANGNDELGDTIANDILKLRPMSAGNYVQLAHCYASTKKWEGVGEVWTHMRSLGLRKIPGWSFIDIHGIITTFFTDHNSHPQFLEIVDTMKILRKEMNKMEEVDINFESKNTHHYNICDEKLL